MTDLFAETSPMLLGLAYRMLGSRADAEDAVQDTFLKWQDADQAAIENPAAWLTTACTRRCIDLLRAAHRTRVDYVGPWLPEPIHTATAETAEDRLALGSSLATAFLLLLERLTPKERAAYLLHEIFDVPYEKVATTLGMQEAACRKLVSRARGNVEQAKVRHVTPADTQDRLLGAFETAITAGDTDGLAALLSEHVTLCADGGGKVPALDRVLRGRAEVVDYIGQHLSRFWGPYEWVVAQINGAKGLILRKDGHITTAVTFGYDEAGRLADIFIMRNPDKLARLEATAIG
jgi:RNA polymerase sigma-70 factor (ECF subfamily)